MLFDSPTSTVPLDDKLTFSGTYFNFIVQNIGNFHTTQLESHLSLINKIVFQWENGTTGPKHQHARARNITNHFSNPYLNKDDIVFKHYLNSHTQIHSFLTEFHSEPDEKKQNRIINQWFSTSVFFSQIKTLEANLEQNYFNHIYDCFEEILFNTDVLAGVQDDLIYYLNLIVSELLFKGYSISELFNYMKGIMADPELFPYSNELIEMSKTERETRRWRMPLEERMRGLKTLYYRTQKDYIFYFKAYNVHINEASEFNLFDVSFHHKYQEIFYEIFEKNTDHPRRYEAFKRFFEGEDFVLAHTIVKSVDYDKAYKVAISKVNKAIKAINNHLDSKIYINQHKYLHSVDNVQFGGRQRLGKGYNLKSWHVSEIENLDAVLFLESVSGRAKQEYLQKENMFRNTVYFSENAKLISDLWVYLEALIGKPMQEKIAFCVLVNKSFQLQKIILNYIYRCAHDFIDSTVRNKVLTEQRNLRLEKFTEVNHFLSSQNIHPFLRYLFELYIEVHTSPTTYLREVNLLDKSLMKEGYEIRNFYLHNGIFNSKTVMKLDATFTHLVAEFRWLLMDRIKQETDNSKTLEDIVAKLEIEGKGLIP